MQLVNNFISTVNSNWIVFLLIFLITAAIYFFLFKRQLFSLFDPFTVMLFSNISSTAVVIFMSYYSMCSSFYAVNYLITEAALVLGLLSVKPIVLGMENPINKIDPKYLDKQFYEIFFLLCSILFVLASATYYFRYGIPLFSSGSRLDTQTNFIASIITGCASLLFILIIDNIQNYKSNRRSIFVISIIMGILYILTLLISGSKSSFLSCIELAALYFIFRTKESKIYSKWKKINLYLFVLFFIAVILALVLVHIRIQIDYAGNQIKPTVFQYLFERIVSYGDAYIYYYMSGVSFSGGGFINGLLLIFSPVILVIKNILKIFGISIFSNYPQPIGLTMYQTINHTSIIGGPNSRYNVFGLFYFGFTGSIIFSFIMGVTISLVRNKLYNKLKDAKHNLIIYILVTNIAVMMIGDISLAMTILKQTIIVVVALVIATIVIKQLIIHVKKKKKDHR